MQIQSASFMSSPVEINTETYYAVDNYGSSMTPFYSNLAIWVGGIVLIAIFKMEVDKDELHAWLWTDNIIFWPLALIYGCWSYSGIHCLPW